MLVHMNININYGQQTSTELYSKPHQLTYVGMCMMYVSMVITLKIMTNTVFFFGAILDKLVNIYGILRTYLTSVTVQTYN
jgi:hypothetical protein